MTPTPFDRALEDAADAYDTEMSKTVEDWSDIKSFIAGGNWARAFTQGEMQAEASEAQGYVEEQDIKIMRLEAELAYANTIITTLANDSAKEQPYEYTQYCQSMDYEIDRLSKENAELREAFEAQSSSANLKLIMKERDEWKARAEKAEKCAPGNYTRLAEENNELRTLCEQLAALEYAKKHIAEGLGISGGRIDSLVERARRVLEGIKK